MQGGHGRKASSHPGVPARICALCPVLAILSKLGLGLKKKKIEKNVYLCARRCAGAEVQPPG